MTKGKEQKLNHTAQGNGIGGRHAVGVRKAYTYGKYYVQYVFKGLNTENTPMFNIKHFDTEPRSFLIILIFSLKQRNWL